MKFEYRILPILVVTALLVGVVIDTHKAIASGIQALATLFVNTTPVVGGNNGDCLKIGTAKLAASACTSGGTIASTTNTLTGDGVGNAIAAIGTGTDCVHVDGSSAACSSGGGGLTFPFTVVQEGACATPGNTSSFLCSFGQAAAASGNTMLIFCGADGSAAVSFSGSYTTDISSTQASFARIMVLHKTTASDTGTTVSMTNSTIACEYMEIVGAHTLDQMSTTGASTTASTPVSITPGSITPTAGAAVFALVGTLGVNMFISQTANPAWHTINVGQGAGSSQRSLMGHVYNGTATGAAMVAPQVHIEGLFFTSGGAAVALFSFL